ncbi:uncharacterized protein LOC128800977 [Vidua chalybeata]|uniref:uncharacterized protein LOC128800977 n=1 Tax=Vidua chalybeata TaxID=81927 RepID=UPI0023A84F0E|nr:uncharacterized protein LOC128800977 [Vidua chalybeata]
MLVFNVQNLIGVFGRPTKKITFVTNGLVNNLNSYGIEIAAMCSGLTTYMAYEVHTFQGPQVNLESCITLDVLRVVDLKYCIGNGSTQQIPSGIFNNTQVIIGGQSQIVTINRQWRVAIIERRNVTGSWKTIWNYNTGVIATKVTQQNTCYISIMNRSEMPRFDNLAHLAQESRNLIGVFGRPTKKITFVTNGLVNNLYSYGINIAAMCSGLTTYLASEVHTFQGSQGNLGSCITLDVLRVVELQYCNSNGNSQQIPSGIFNNTQVIIGGQSQVVTVNRQWRVAVIEQRSYSGSWKTVWNYNTGVIATKVRQQNTCYISIMNRSEMPRFDDLARLAQESRNLIGVFGRPTKKITFVTNGLVNNLNSYGIEIAAMCSGLTTYMAYEVHTFQGPQVNLESCITLDVLRVVDLKYCIGNGSVNFPTQQIPSGIFNNTQVIIGGQSQIVTINRQWRVAIIERRNVTGSWKTIWNYNTGVIATKVTQQNTCYISIMNRSEMPRFDNLAHLAQESRNLIGVFGRPTKKITFVTNGLVNNLYSYGINIAAMCSGLTTYLASEVHTFQGSQGNLGSCITLDVLRVVELQYCNSNGNSQQIPSGIFNNTQVIIGGQSQVVTINRQWRVAVIEQRNYSGSWKTVWNYNTGVIATKVRQQNTCYISIMNRSEMPRFDDLARLAQESRNLIGVFGRPTKKITFVTNGLVNNLNSYGIEIAAMCSGLTTYMAYEVHSECKAWEF